MVYKLIFYVSTPIITTTDIHLDAVFSAVSPAAHNKEYYISRHTKFSDIKQLPIPIDCIKIDNEFLFCCSVADYHNANLICDSATKRKDGNDFLFYHRQLTPRKGIEKDSMLKLYGVSCEFVSFLLSSSNKNSVIRYARRIHNIGAMRKQGYGLVNKFEIEEMPNLVWKDCVINNNKAIRNIPQAFLENECHSFSPCKTPYWLLDGSQKCATVGEFADIKNDVFLSEFKR